MNLGRGTCCAFAADFQLVVDLLYSLLHSVLYSKSKTSQSKWSLGLSLLSEGLDVPQAPTVTSSYHQQTYGDRLAQTRGDLKLLEQLVSQTFHLPPQHQSTIVYDSTYSGVTDQQPVILYSRFCSTAVVGRTTGLARLSVCLSVCLALSHIRTINSKTKRHRKPACQFSV